MLFDTFRKSYDAPLKAVDLSVELLAAAEQYAAFESPDDAVWSAYSKEARAIVGSLKLLGSQQVHPVILSGLAKLDVAEMQKLLKLLEVCIVRFLLIVGGNPGRFEPACAKLAEAIYKGAVHTAAAAFAELKSSGVYPSDAEFESAFRLKSERNSQKARYFLRAIEREAQFKAKGKLANEMEPAQLTLEHILPKKPGSDWKAVTLADKELAEDCTHRLGNMCLLTTINKELGQKSFAKKKLVYGKSQLMTTKDLASVSDWNRGAIELRQSTMGQFAKAIWRFK